MNDGTATRHTTAALSFLREIAPGESVTFQTFDDTEQKRRTFARVLEAQAETLPPELAELNASGAGVYFTVNATDGKGRAAANVSKVRALFIDCDTADPRRVSRLMALPLPPSAIIESSPDKHHAYWYVTDWPLEEFKGAQRRLAQAFESDTKVCDLSRVMRLPGYMHNKGEPFTVRRVGGDGRRHDAATMAAMLDELAPTSPQEGPAARAVIEADPYARRALHNAIGAVAMAREGERNDTLNREAFGLFGLVNAGRLDTATVSDALTRSATSIGLEHGEIAATLASASTAPARHDGMPESRPADVWRLSDGSAAAGAPLAPPPTDNAWASVISLENLERADPPFFWTAEWLPAGTTTLLAAHGGTGKSTLALQWAVCAALGLPFLGKATTAGRVLFYSAEDDGVRVRHRLRVICEAYGIATGALADRLLLLDATNIDPSLYAEAHNPVTRTRDFRPTDRYDRLREEAENFRADFLIIDNASDTYDAEENARARVRSFMRALNVIAKERDAAVLLLAHVDKNTAKNSRDNGEGYSGSTAWHNSARSRLFMSASDGRLLLEHQKCNVGPLASPVCLRWSDGLIVTGEPVDNAATELLRVADTKALLHLIWEFTDRGEPVSPSPNARNNARALLAGQPAFPQAMKRGSALFDLLRDAERAGHIERATYRTPDRKDREQWKVTACGMEWAGIAPTAPTAPTSEEGAENPEGAS